MPEPLRVHIAGQKSSFYSPQTSGYQRCVLLDAVLGRLHSPHAGVRVALRAWRPSEQFRAWTFSLRPGLKFHNGREASALDLEFSIAHILLCAFETPEKSLLRNIAGAGSLEPGAPYRPGCVPGIEVVDGSTVRIRLADPDPFFASLIQESSFSLVPREELRPPGTGLDGPSANSGSHLSWKRHPVGAGAYRVVRVGCDGAEVELESAGELEPGAPKRLLFTSGECGPEVDFAVGYASNPLPGRLRKAALDAPFATQGVYFEYAHPWARDLRFRQAVCSAIDRAKVTALFEDAEPAHGIIPSHLLKKLSKKPELESSFDPARAARLFREVVGRPEKAPILIPVGTRFSGTRLPAWMMEIEAQLKRAGLPVRFVRGRCFEPLEPTREVAPFYLVGFIPSLPEPAQIFQVFREGSGWISRLDERDSIYEGLLERVAREREERKREDALRALSDRFLERNYAVPIFEQPVVFWVNPERVLSVGEDCQGIGLFYEKILVRQDG